MNFIFSQYLFYKERIRVIARVVQGGRLKIDYAYAFVGSNPTSRSYKNKKLMIKISYNNLSLDN